MTDNEKIEKISSLLGGYNCGGCGYDTCLDCARKIVEGEVSADSCLPIDSANLDIINEILANK